MNNIRLHEYQEKVVDYIISHKSCGLLLDMGLGKTLCTLFALYELIKIFDVVKKVLIIAPLTVAESTWTKELEKCQNIQELKLIKTLGTEKERIKALNKIGDIYIINRENIPWIIEFMGKKWDFDLLVIDELSSFKSCKTKRFKYLKKIRDKVDRVIGLTGTPTPNSLIDIWSQIYLLDNGERLGRYITHFKNTYFYPLRQKGNIVYTWGLKDNAEDKIYKKISDICLSMKSKDYLKLPPKINRYIDIPLPKIKMKLYKKLERDYVLQLNSKKIIATEAAVLINKLIQFANGCVYDENKGLVKIHDEKLKKLKEIISKSENSNILIFFNYKHDLERIKSTFKETYVLDAKNSQIINRWNEGKIKLLLLHPKSAGHGLNLQYGGHIIVWFSLTYSLELYEQANARLNRQGQKAPVIIYHLIAKNTIDEKIIKALENKSCIQENLLRGLKNIY